MPNVKRSSILACALVAILFLSFFSPIFSAQAWEGDSEGIIEVIRDPRLSITTIGPVPTFIFTSINVNVYLVLRSDIASTSDYCEAILQNFGIDLVSDGYSDYPEVFTFILEVEGIGGLLNYLKQHFGWAMPSWLVDEIEAQYISPDGGVRLVIPIGWKGSWDLHEVIGTMFDIVSSAIDIYKALSAKVPLLKLGAEDIIASALHLVDDLISLLQRFFNIGLYVFLGSLKTIGAYSTRMLFNVLSTLQFLRETIEFFRGLQELSIWLSRLRIALFWLRLGVDFIIPGVGWADLVRTAASTVASLIYDLLETFWTDSSWWRELVLGAIRVVTRWLDPPETKIYASVYNTTTNELLLGYNPTTGLMVNESPVGFMLNDNSSQNFVLFRSPSYNLTLTSVGEPPESLPFTISLMDQYFNETLGTSGYLAVGESASLMINATETETQVSNHLVALASVSTTCLAQGEPVTVNITVTDSLGTAFADANVSLLINNARVTADNLGSGLYRAVIDTSDLLGPISIGVYASYPGMIGGYDAVLLEVVDATDPVANAGPDKTVDEDTLVTFDGSASWDNVGIVSYTWTFIDVTPQTLTGVNPSYTFNTPNIYTITLNVTDAAGNWATDTVVITVVDITNPVANAGQSQTVNVEETVTFNASDSTDNVGIVSYEWDFGDGTTGTGVTTNHTYTNPGAYTVTLTVEDAAGNSDIDSVTVTVLPIEALPLWIIAGAVAVIGIAIAATVLWRRRK